MTFGFDKPNLDAAVAKVIELAAAAGHETSFLSGTANAPAFKIMDLSDPVQVRTYLKAKADEAFNDGQPRIPGLIHDVVYRTIGVVFEHYVEDAMPALEPLSSSAGTPTHMAMFWHTL